MRHLTLYDYSCHLMDRYIITEFSVFFLFSVSLFTCLGVAIGTASDLAYKITEYRLPIPVAIQIFCYKIPEYAAYALPISTLLTGLVVYGRLKSDRELTALLSFGISFYRIFLPALIFSLFITGITFLLSEFIVPTANYQANLLQNPFIPQTELNLNKHNIYYAEYKPSLTKLKKLEHIYYAERYDGQRLLEVTIISFDDRLTQIITAKSAQWNKGKQVWDLRSGTINQFNSLSESIEEFTTKELSYSKTIFDIVTKERSPEDMNIRQAKEYLSLIHNSGKSTDVAKLAVRIQQKYAFPFICVIFTLIGSALGAKYSQLNRAKSFGLCVVIVFGYYCLGFAIGSLGITGVISPFWAAWLPNAIALAIGGYLLKTVND